MLNLLAYSLDFVRSCFGLREFCVMEDFRGRLGLGVLCKGGRVEDRPGGECDITEGSSSRGLGEWNGGTELC